MSQRSKHCLVGIPDHQGVLNVGGRIGAAEGPHAFRKAFARMSGLVPVHERLRDAGDVTGLGADAAANHEIAAARLAQEMAASEVSVVVGGGHDHGYSQLLGLSQSSKRKIKLGCINIDAHLDLRKADPVPSSGSPFWLAIESGVLDPKRFVEFGIQSQCNAPALWDYAARKKIAITPFEQLRGGRAVKAFAAAIKKLAASCDRIVVSLDLDSVAQAYAPGVSAPQAEGFTPSEILEMVEIAARIPKAASLGIFELNPVHDLDDRTARLAATAAWRFLERKKS